MSFETITITRQIPVINGYVQLPNNLEKNKSSVSLEALMLIYPNVVINSLTAQTGRPRTAGGKFGIQQFVEFSEPLSCCGENTTANSIKTIFYADRPTDDNDRNPADSEGRTSNPADRPNDPNDDEYPDNCSCDYTTEWLSIVLQGSNMLGCECSGGGLDANDTTYTLQYIAQEGVWYLSSGETGYSFIISCDPNEGCWNLTITCITREGVATVWHGHYYGNSPIGEYVYENGCGGPWEITSVSVEETVWN